MMRYCVAGCVFAFMCLGATGCGKTPEAGEAASAVESTPVTFEGGIGHLLAERCGTCHIEDSKGGFSLANLDTALAGGKSGVVVQANDPEQSLIYQMVSGAPGVKRMPPRGEPLGAEEIAQVKAWIEAGAR